MKTQTELAGKKVKQLEEEKQKNKITVQDLEKEIQDKREMIKYLQEELDKQKEDREERLEARIKYLLEVLDKQQQFILAKSTELEQEREGLGKQIEDLKKENKHTAIQAAERIERLVEQLADKEQEVIKLIAINEERAVAHKEELERVNIQLEEKVSCVCL